MRRLTVEECTDFGGQGSQNEVTPIVTEDGSVEAVYVYTTHASGSRTAHRHDHGSISYERLVVAANKRVEKVNRMTEKLEPPLIISDIDEELMRNTLLVCYGTNTLGFRVSSEHYRYLAEQVVALREAWKRRATTLNSARLATHIVREVCELPDRNSPDDQPEMLLVTCDELHGIVMAAIEKENTNVD